MPLINIKLPQFNGNISRAKCPVVTVCAVR